MQVHAELYICMLFLMFFVFVLYSFFGRFWAMLGGRFWRVVFGLGMFLAVLKALVDMLGYALIMCIDL